MGILRSITQGGANGVLGGLAAMGLDPAKFNLASGLGKELEMIGVTFLLAAIVGMMTFLKTHQGPDPETPVAA
jgi:hypothetical protein